MQYPRSHTDPLANLVVLSALDISRHLDEIVRRDMPIGTLPTFLHEVTHHWCFDTPVGVALHLLFLQARRSAWIGLKQRSEDHAWDTLDSVVRYEAALNLLRPLSEGLALFAEHDVIPGQTRIISRPMQIMACVYGRAVAVRGETPYGKLPLVLAAARLSRHHLRRKADLYIQPMTCDEGGYLPGYLLVKCLWADALRQSPIFLDTDFFFQYLCSHIFHDWSLVAALLDDSKRDISAIDGIQQRIGARLDDFIETAVRGNRPEKFEDLSEKSAMLKVDIRTELLETQIEYLPLPEDQDAELGRARLRQCVEVLFNEQPDDDFMGGLLQQDLREVSLRSVINLGHTTLEGRPDGDCLGLYSDGDRLATVPRELFAEDDFTSGSIEIDIIQLPNLGGLCAVLMRDKRVLCSMPFGNFEVPESVAMMMADRQARATLVELSQDVIREALGTADINYIRDISRETVTKSLNRSLIRAVLSRAPDASKVMQDTAVDGLLPVLGGDLNLVLDAAALSLCLPSGYDFHALDTFHRWSTNDPAASAARIDHLLQDRLGWPGFARHEGKLWLSFV